MNKEEYNKSVQVIIDRYKARGAKFGFDEMSKIPIYNSDKERDLFFPYVEFTKINSTGDNGNWTFEVNGMTDSEIWFSQLHLMCVDLSNHTILTPDITLLSGKKIDFASINAEEFWRIVKGRKFRAPFYRGFLFKIPVKQCWHEKEERAFSQRIVSLFDEGKLEEEMKKSEWRENGICYDLVEV